MTSMTKVPVEVMGKRVNQETMEWEEFVKDTKMLYPARRETVLTVSAKRGQVDEEVYDWDVEATED